MSENIWLMPGGLVISMQASLRYIKRRHGPSGFPFATGGIVSLGPESAPDPAEVAGPAVAPGSVTGYRWWTLPGPDWRLPPGNADRDWPHGLLRGAQGTWQPGVNTASCISASRPSTDRPEHSSPARGCSCGFWARWQPEDSPLGRSTATLPVFGVIKAWGRFRRGPREFRAEKARILALHLPFALGPEVRPRNPLEVPRSGWYEWPPRPGRNPLEGQAAFVLRDGTRLLLPREYTTEQAQAFADHAEAWVAVVGDRLACDYGVPVFETRNALLACYPPDPVYGHCAGPDIWTPRQW